MTIPVLILHLNTAALAAEFDVGAGFEFVGLATSGSNDVGVAQAELDARLGVGPLRLRVDIDLLGPGPFGAETRTGTGALKPFPEWGAAIMGAPNGWMIATGFQPHPVNNEQVDGWSNLFVPYTMGFTELWPSYFLGIRAQGGAMDGALITSVWGGARSDVAFSDDGLVFGGSAALAGQKREEVRARAALSVFPVERLLLASASVAIPVGDSVKILGDGTLGAGDGLRGSLAGTLVLFPDWQVSPAMRIEGAEGLGSPWALDAGVAWRPDDALRVKLSGRVESGEAWLYAGVSLIDDVEPGKGWRFAH